jgi:hypothetical protein
MAVKRRTNNEKPYEEKIFRNAGEMGFMKKGGVVKKSKMKKKK